MRRLVGTSQPDQHDIGPGLLEAFPVVAQLRDVLAAERSPEVPQESQDRRGIAPIRGEIGLMTTRVQDNNIGCRIADLRSVRHGRSLPAARRISPASGGIDLRHEAEDAARDPFRSLDRDVVDPFDPLDP